MAELPRRPYGGLALIAALASVRFRWATEDELQRGIAQALTEQGHVVEREVRLNARDRIDLLIGRVGVEVKVKGAWRDVERQLMRYLESDRLDELVLVTARAQHLRIPSGDITGKTLHVHQLTASGL